MTLASVGSVAFPSPIGEVVSYMREQVVEGTRRSLFPSPIGEVVSYISLCQMALLCGKNGHLRLKIDLNA